MSEKVERLINLVVALLETRRPLTLEEIKSKVRGYEHDDPESARRLFERDKDDLRRLGVPLETLPIDAFESDWGYRVDRRAYELPPIDLEAEEITALVVALHLTGEDPARLGLTKVAALAPDPVDPTPPTARINVGLDDLEGLAEALVERRTLAFGYRTATGEESARTVDPYGLIQRGGAWYLVGRDHDRDAKRVFRLDRMTSSPDAVGEPGAFSPPEDFDITATRLGPEGETVDLRLRLSSPAAGIGAHRGEVLETQDDGTIEVLYRDADPSRMVPRILALGADAEVLGPPSVRDEIAARLKQSVADHTSR
jgi:proteasome accessory factor B